MLVKLASLHGPGMSSQSATESGRIRAIHNNSSYTMIVPCAAGTRGYQGHRHPQAPSLSAEQTHQIIITQL